MCYDKSEVSFDDMAQVLRRSLLEQGPSLMCFAIVHISVSTI
jgi:hypothetical protein